MNIEELDALLAQLDSRFNELKVEEGAVKHRLETIDTDLKRLQGEAKAYGTLKDALLQRAPQGAQEQTQPVDPATLTPDPFKSVEPKEKAVYAAN